MRKRKRQKTAADLYKAFSAGGKKGCAGLTSEELSKRGKAAARARWDAVEDHICRVVLPNGRECGAIRKSEPKLARHQREAHFERKRNAV